MKADGIIKIARGQIVDFLKYEMRMLYTKLTFGDNRLAVAEGEPIEIEADDLPRCPSVDVEVDNSYLDVDDCCSEPRKLESLILDENGELTIVVEVDVELNVDDISINDLVAITNAVQYAYEH